jgi:Ser/Thr protein kinase RdoA (MazF antagonist)
MSIPHEVLRAYGLEPGAIELRHIPSNINVTYIVEPREAGAEWLVLQRLHPVFGEAVHIDIEAVTTHLGARGLETPHLIRTRAGELWTRDGEAPTPRVWRAQSYVDGVTHHASRDAAVLESGAGLVAAFHRALADLRHEFVHRRPLHDTPRHLANLEAALSSDRGRGDAAAQALGGEVLRHAEGVRRDFEQLPKRIIHGDPKLSNVLFRRDAPERALCMIDLDTVARGPLAYELGDALRSWCNPAGEDTSDIELAPSAVAAVLRGYARACPAGVSRDELGSALDGFETVSLELASRFAADVVVDQYWGWDATRFASRRDHNLLRARGQLALSKAVRAQRAALARVVDDASRELGRGSA